MTRLVLRWAVPVAALTVVALLGSGCGREAPVFQTGSIAVSSEPDGAAIFLDGQDTGLVTPDTLTALEPGTYNVSVALEGYLASPDMQTAVVSPLRTSSLAPFALSQTSLLVTSVPGGATVYIDGQDTGLTTPATVVGVPAGSVEVSLVLDGYLVSPTSYTVDVTEGQANEVPGGTFALRSLHTVLFEGFSNVSCQGCPDMAANMEAAMHREGFGLDRVLYVKYSMSWPSATDPHYTHNTAENNARMNYYLDDLISGIPVLTMEGVKVTGNAANATPDSTEIGAFAASALESDPGFLLDVSADFSGASVPVNVTVTALDDVALAGKTLAVVLIQTLIEYQEAPGSEGETEFHNVFRDRADQVDALTDLTAGQTQTITTNVLRDNAWDISTMQVIAFVQDDTDKTILQAGSTDLSGSEPASLFFDNHRHTRTITSGGE